MVPSEVPCVVLGNSREIPRSHLGSYAGIYHHTDHRSPLLALSRMEGIDGQNVEVDPLVQGAGGLLVHTYPRGGRVDP